MTGKLELAFCLFNYFPFGGLQQDFMRLSRLCSARGHHVSVFTGSWAGPVPDEMEVNILKPRGLTNHGRAKSFAAAFERRRTAVRFDAVVGFNKMPGLDLYFASDPCFAARAALKGPLYRATPRCRVYSALEREVFRRESKTRILLLSEPEKIRFIRYYETSPERFHLLPPGISREFLTESLIKVEGSGPRREMGLDPGQKLVLMVGSGFKTKGVDRAIRAVASLPDGVRHKTTLMVVGRGHSRGLLRLARRLGIEDHVLFAGGREDVPGFLAESDLLLHPARLENTGSVLIEAMASGLPVLASDVCGYSPYVRDAGAGELIPEPFRQDVLDKMLARMLTSADRKGMAKNGRAFVRNNDVFSLHEKAAEIIEEVAC